MSEPGPVSRRFGSLTIAVAAGDITRFASDAIVNAANNQFWMGGGVAGAIKREGGEQIEKEAMKQGPVAAGESVVTTAGKLRARYCIHAAVMDQDLITSAELIERATRTALARAAELELESIAFPALGTGVGGFPLDEAARTMFKAATGHAQQHPKPSLVTFVLVGQTAYSTFVTELDRFHA